MSIHRCRPVKARTGGRKSGPSHPSGWKVGNEDVHYSVVYNRKAGNIMPVFEGPGCTIKVQLSEGWALEDEHLSIWNERVEINRRLENRNCCIF